MSLTAGASVGEWWLSGSGEGGLEAKSGKTQPKLTGKIKAGKNLDESLGATAKVVGGYYYNAMSRLCVLERVFKPEKYPELGNSKNKSSITGCSHGIVGLFTT